MTPHAPQTEAACLFQTGALYGRRALLQAEGTDPVFAGFKPGAFSLYFGDAPIYHLDIEGRWQRAYLDGLHYLKSLDGTVQTIDRVREGSKLVLRRRTLSPAEADRADARVRAAALELLDALGTDRLRPSGPPPKGRPLPDEDLSRFLHRVVTWDASAWARHRDQYRATYGPLPFVPPDTPAPVVLQATLGHESGKAYGGAPGEPFHARRPEGFDRHARDVAALLGRRVEQAKTVFLAGPDVLRRPAEDVAAYLEIASRVFPIDPTGGRRHPDPTGEAPHSLDGVHAFLDCLEGPMPRLDDWRNFRALGLTRVGLGVESGDPGIRALYGKSWPDDALRAAVSDLKSAGLGVSLAVLVGAGGVEASEPHTKTTAGLLSGLDLGPGDVVALLDARELAGPRPDMVPLSDDEFVAQREHLRAGLAPLRGGKKAKVVSYSLEKQGAV